MTIINRISGEKNKFIATKDLIVYTPYIYPSEKSEDGYTLKTSKTEINEDPNNYGKNIIIGEYRIFTEVYTDFYKTIIPKGTTYYISDDLDEITPELFYVTDKIEEGKTDLSDLYKYGADVYTKNGKRYKVTSEEYNKEDVIGIFVDDNKIMSINIKTEILKLLDWNSDYNEFSIYDKGDERFDINGEENTKHILGKLIEDKWYLPAYGELIEFSENLLEINLTLEYLGKQKIDSNSTFFRTSTLCTEKSTYSFKFKNTKDIVKTLFTDKLLWGFLVKNIYFYRTE